MPTHSLAAIHHSPQPSSSSSSKPQTRYRSITNVSENASPKQIYTFSNPPRELDRNNKSSRAARLPPRVSSAPNEHSSQDSPRSLLDQAKPYSANGALIPVSHEEGTPSSTRPRAHADKDEDEQQKTSFHALMKEQERSNVPKAVQKRRIVLLFPRSPRGHEHSSPVSGNAKQVDERHILHTATNHRPSSVAVDKEQSLSKLYPHMDPLAIDDTEPEIADSMQLAAILANIQLQDDWNSNATACQHQETRLDPKKYEYVVSNPLDTATFKLSPRTLKPDEESAARSRFSHYYRSEMRFSANAQIPPLIASIVTENTSTMGHGTASEKTFTFRLNSTGQITQHSPSDHLDLLESTMESEYVQLCYDATLNGFYDPNTGKYYELTST